MTTMQQQQRIREQLDRRRDIALTVATAIVGAGATALAIAAGALMFSL